ncbi:MAG: MarR family transcriptional regulator [Myxococcaceae bacterium]|nr:MarR family transcriptional regulator [Myxococcaceae bacterium]
MTLVEQLASVRRALHRVLSRRLSRRTDRPFTQMLALKVISRGEVRSQAALAERLLVDAPAVSRMVERLAEEGLLKRCAGEDRRCVRLEVTPAGRAQAAVFEEEGQWLEGELRKHLTAQEVKMLRQLLEKVQEGLRRAEESSVPAEEERAE